MNYDSPLVQYDSYTRIGASEDLGLRVNNKSIKEGTRFSKDICCMRLPNLMIYQKYFLHVNSVRKPWYVFIPPVITFDFMRCSEP